MVAKIQRVNEHHFLFIDDKTYSSKLLYFTFDRYILHEAIHYFTHVQKNVFFIKEDEKLPENILNRLKNYDHLVSYVEVNKSDI